MLLDSYIHTHKCASIHTHVHVQAHKECLAHTITAISIRLGYHRSARYTNSKVSDIIPAFKTHLHGLEWGGNME